MLWGKQEQKGEKYFIIRNQKMVINSQAAALAL